MKTKTTLTRRALALCMSVLMLMTAWVFVAPTKAAAASTWNGSQDNPGSSGYTDENNIIQAKKLGENSLERILKAICGGQ